MDWAGFLDVRVLAPLIAGLLLLGLAAWLAYLDFESKLHRALALFLFLRGMANVGNGFIEVPELHDVWTRLTPYFGIALPFALLHLAHRYHVDRAGAKRQPWVVPLLIVLGFAAQVWYLLDHSTFTARNAAGRVVFGPLFLSVGLLYVLYALAASRLARDYTRIPAEKREPSLLITAVALALLCINTGLYYFLVFLPGPPDLPGSGGVATGPPPIPAILAGLMLAGSLFALTPFIIRLLKVQRRDEDPRARRALLSLLLPVGTALIASAAAFVSQSLSLTLVLVFGAVWTLAFGLLGSYALVRHGLFDIDARIKITIRRGTVAAFFVATYFVVGELAQNLLTSRYDWLVGTLAAGLLLVALHPLQRIAQRVADASVPTKPVEDLSTSQRRDVFLEQLRIAWADGKITRKERLMIDGARDRLGIPLVLAHDLEAQVLRDTQR